MEESRVRGGGQGPQKHAVPMPTKHKFSTVLGFPFRTEFYWNSAQGLEPLCNGIGNGKRTNPHFLPLLSPSAARPSAGWSQMTWSRGGSQYLEGKLKLPAQSKPLLRQRHPDSAPNANPPGPRCWLQLEPEQTPLIRIIFKSSKETQVHKLQ